DVGRDPLLLRLVDIRLIILLYGPCKNTLAFTRTPKTYVSLCVYVPVPVLAIQVRVSTMPLISTSTYPNLYSRKISVGVKGSLLPLYVPLLRSVPPLVETIY